MSISRGNSFKGYAFVITAAFLWASSGNAGKALFNDGMDAFELVQIRITLAASILGLALAVFKRELLKIRIKDIGYFLLLGSIGMSILQGSYFYAISKIQVAAAILIQYMAPIFVAIYSMLFWKEKFSLSKGVSLLLAFGGCYLVVGGYNLDLLSMNRIGIAAGLISAVIFAAYTLLGERGMHRYKPFTVLFYALAFATIPWHVFYAPFHYLTAGFTLRQWWWITYIAVAGTILPFGLYFVGVNYIRSTHASITATLEPIIAGVIAFLILHEKMEILQIMGGIMVIAAIIIIQLCHQPDNLSPEIIRGKSEI